MDEFVEVPTNRGHDKWHQRSKMKLGIAKPLIGDIRTVAWRPKLVWMEGIWNSKS